MRLSSGRAAISRCCSRCEEMENSSMNLLRCAVCACGLLSLYARPAAGIAADGDWQVVRVDGRDYILVENVAKFYGFPSPVPPASQLPSASVLEPLTKRLTLDNGRQSIQLTLNSREVLINGVRQWLAFPVTAQDDKLLLSRLDLAKALEPNLRPEMIAGMNPVETIVLDPGHGGHDKGATSIFGSEKDFALDVCLRAKSLIEAKGLKVVLTRASDIFIPLERRPAVANPIPNSIFVAVHFNDATWNPAASGFEIYSVTPRGAPSTADATLSTRDLRNEPGNAVDVPSLALSLSIYHSMLGNIPEADRGIKHARFAVIRLSTVPAVLIEGGFVSSTDEARLIALPSWRQKLAEAIVSGVENYKALAEHHVPPKTVADYRRTAPPGQQQSPTVMTNASGQNPAAPEAPKTQ